MNWKPHLPEIFLGISLALIAVEAALAGAAMIKARYRLKDTLASLGMQAGNIAMNLMMAGIVFAGLSAVYQVRLFSISPSSPWAWVAIFFLDDFIYYWFHRISHECRFFWASHVVHHSSQHYNLGTALRQTWTGNFMTFIFWLWLPLIGFKPIMVLTMQSISLLYQFWIHTELVRRMGPLEWVLNTPSHHRVHHGSNQQYLDRNHAGVLIIWDRLFSSFEPEGEKVVYGLTKNINSYNPLRIAFHEWIDIWRDVRQADTWRLKLRYIFGRPGWKEEKSRATGVGSGL